MADWTLIVVLVAAGLILIAVDFYIPGFVLGTIGIILMLFAVGICYRAYGTSAALVAFLVVAALGGLAGYTAIHYVPKTRAGKKMILAHTQEGVRSQAGLDAWLGHEGVAQTILRPTGIALLDGQRLDVTAETGLIERGSSIRVVAVTDNRLIVRKVTATVALT